ncbi:MAG: hypothetical protein WB816_11900 [Methylocystis sp.]
MRINYVSADVKDLILADAKISSFGGTNKPWTVPEVDLARQAIAPLRGYPYQLHQSAGAWITLKDSELLHLEVAEDFSQILREPGAIDEILSATQVKDTRESGGVTLNSADVIGAIEKLFGLQASNPGREVRLTFLTTSEIGKERKNPLPSGAAGIAAWSAAAEGGDVAEIRAALLDRIRSTNQRNFIEHSSDEELRFYLLTRLKFACGAGGWKTIEENNRNDLMAFREEVRSTADMAHRAYDAVLSHVLTTILSSSTRMLDRFQLIACLERATAVSVPSQVAVDLLEAPAIGKASGPIDLADLTALARTLLDVGAPPSIAMLFSDAAPAARLAFSAATALERTLIESDARDRPAARATISELITMSEAKHLVVGQPGSGKSHALWRTANQLLNAGEVIPLLLPAAQLNTWNDVVSLITDVAPSLSIDGILGDQRVCVCIDGWSEFAIGETAGEKRKAVRALRSVRVIANGKFADVGDTTFKIWSIELLSPNQVADVVERARPGEPVLSNPVLNLLRLPLLLSMHVLSEANASATGELLRQFHDYLARHLPEGFTEALAGAVAASALANDRSYGRLVLELRTRANAKGFVEPEKLLQRLGTIVERSGQALPIHDLYWSWLVGRGLVAGQLAADAIEPLHTRESYALALQSGARAIDEDVRHAVNDDLVLAAALDASQRSRSPNPILAACLERALSDDRLAVQSRGGLAALEIARPEYLRRALDVLSKLSQAKLYVNEWQQALRPAILFPQRAILGDWIGLDGSDFVLDAIAERGGAEWAPWLEQMALSGRITYVEALAVALGCSCDVPAWGRPHLEELIRLKPWKLRAAAARRSNVALARWIGAAYERLVETVIPQNSGSWLDLNRVLVACADDEVFRFLLARFGSMAKRPQELLGFAVVDRGRPWIAAFQKIAFATPSGGHHHKLAAALSPEIDDATARAWIAAGYDEVGWRVLITRHGEAILPELVANLPPSFAYLHHIPALANMRFFERAPVSLIEELWSRLGSPMQPKAMQDVLNALATVYPEGVASIVRFVCAQPNALPSYHLTQVLRLYDEWRQKLGADLGVQLPTGETLPFSRWVALHSVHQRFEDHFTPMMLSSSAELAIEVVLQHFQDDDDKAAAVLNALNDVKSYHAQLLNRMLATPKLAERIPSVFASCFDTFPAEALHRCLASPNIDQNALLFRLGSTSNPLHRSVHAKLMQRVLESPINLHHYRYLANMLRGHTRHDVLALLKSTTSPDEENAIWLVREVESARGERLVDEAGRLRL